MSGLLASGHVSPIGRAVCVLYFFTIRLTVFGECGSTSSAWLCLVVSLFSSISKILGLRLALKLASWDENLTIYTPLELDRLKKGGI